MPTTKTKNTRKKVALWLLIAPTALLLVDFVVFLVINSIFNPTLWPAADGEPLTPTPIGFTVANLILSFAGFIGVITWVPGLIVGIGLLAAKNPKK